MARTICIVETETCPRTGIRRLVVSHGIDEETLRSIPMPQVPPSELGAKYDIQLGEYVIE